MKYLKLFEQFEDEENDWWDEESPFDFSYTLITDKLGFTYYVAKYNKNNDTYSLFDNYPEVSSKYYRKWNEVSREINQSKIVAIYDRENKYGGKFQQKKDWKYYKYSDLPRKIRELML